MYNQYVPAKTDAFKNGNHFLSNHPIPLLIVDEESLKIFQANEAACSFYEYLPEELTSLSILDLVDVSEKNRLFEQISSGKQSCKSTFKQSTNKGTLIDASMLFSSVEGGEKKWLQVVVVAMEDKSEELKTVQSDNVRYKDFINQRSEAIWRYELDVPVSIDKPADELIEHIKSYSRLAECNIAMVKSYGFENPSEIIGASINQLLDIRHTQVHNLIEAFIKNNFKLVDAESVDRDKEGNLVYLLNSVMGVVENGMLIRAWGTQKNITARKKTEKKIKFLAHLVQETSDVLTAADLEFKPTTWNKAAERIYGISAEQAIGNDLREYISFNYTSATREDVREAIAKEGEWKGEMFFVRPTDKKTITLIISFKLLHDEKSVPLGYVIAGTDISERKETELRIKESENRFREMADSAPVMIWLSDENNITSYVNNLWVKFTGKDITGKGHEAWAECVHPEDLSKTSELWNVGYVDKQQITTLYRLRCHDGGYRWVKDVSVPRFLNSDKFIGYIGTVTDVDDQKKKEEQLLYQATILDNVQDLVVTTDLELRIKSINTIAESALGLKEEDCIGKNLHDVITYTFSDSTKEKVLDDLAHNDVWQGEVFYTQNNGEKRFSLQTITYVKDVSGNKVGIMAVSRDITDRKIAEDKLKNSELFYRSLFADSLDGIILTDENAVVTFVSPSIKNILGYEIEEVVGKNSFEFGHPDDLETAVDAFKKELEGNAEVNFINIRLKHKNGDWIWCMVRGHNLLQNPYVKSIVVYFHDDTSRKNATDALKESEERFRKLVKNLQFGVVLKNTQGKIIMCNRSTLELLELQEEELIGKHFSEVLKDVTNENGTLIKSKDIESYTDAVSKEKVRNIVIGIKRPSFKKRKWLMIGSDPVMDEKGNLLHVICTLTDITERKKLQSKLLEKQLSQQKLITQATIDGQEKERKEIGKELHDNIGQQLTTTKLYLDLAKASADEKTLEMISIALRSIGDIINEVRQISHSLVPPTLGDIGLVESINELRNAVKRTRGLKIVFTHENFDEDKLADNKKLMLYRIVQEQLNNIVRHAQASAVSIELHNHQPLLVLEIADNGKGFDKKSFKKGLGLTNIKNRAELFGGTVEVNSAVGDGCTLTINIPQGINSATDLAEL